MPTKHTTKAEIYSTAAKYLEDGKVCDSIKGACSAIGESMYPTLMRLDAYSKAEAQGVLKPFEDLFKPDEPYASRSYWGNEWAETDAERNDCRILALCFMASMVEAGDA